MYKIFYGLLKDPFTKEIDPSEAFKYNDFVQASSRLEFLKNARGFGVITGEPGSGKTFLLHCFLSTLNPSLYKPIYIPISTVTVNDFYAALCEGLGILPAQKKVKMFTQIQDVIATYYSSKHITPVIVIDEAQFLKNAILDDLRIIFNFGMDTRDYATVILCGQTQFVNQLSRQPLEAIRQRIVVNYTMKGLTKTESVDFISHRLKMAGRTEPLFTEDALELLYSNSNGCLRSLATLARMSLICGSNLKAQTINSEIIYQAQTELAIMV